jgi:hypothetical protein
MATETLIMFAEYGCYGLTTAWCAVYGFIVHLTLFVVEYLMGATLWEDGSYGDGAGTVRGCVEYLGWGCS